MRVYVILLKNIVKSSFVHVDLQFDLIILSLNNRFGIKRVRKIMKKIVVLGITLMMAVVVLSGVSVFAKEKDKAQPPKEVDIVLPNPDKNGGIPLMKALNNRKTEREFSEKQVSKRMLSNLLWAANGINREDGRRTAPTARNKQEIEIYVIWNKAAYWYDAKKNKLDYIKSTDISSVPVMLVYAGDLLKQSKELSFVDSGFIGQNVYLFCASNNLSTVFKANVEREKLAGELDLISSQEVLFTQEVGYPKKK